MGCPYLDEALHSSRVIFIAVHVAPHFLRTSSERTHVNRFAILEQTRLTLVAFPCSHDCLAKISDRTHSYELGAKKLLRHTPACRRRRGSMKSATVGHFWPQQGNAHSSTDKSGKTLYTGQQRPRESLSHCGDLLSLDGSRGS